jgi:hypothetical protein
MALLPGTHHPHPPAAATATATAAATMAAPIAVGKSCSSTLLRARCSLQQPAHTRTKQMLQMLGSSCWTAQRGAERTPLAYPTPRCLTTPSPPASTKRSRAWRTTSGWAEARCVAPYVAHRACAATADAAWRSRSVARCSMPALAPAPAVHSAPARARARSANGWHPLAPHPWCYPAALLQPGPPLEPVDLGELSYFGHIMLDRNAAAAGSHKVCALCRLQGSCCSWWPLQQREAGGVGTVDGVCMWGGGAARHCVGGMRARWRALIGSAACSAGEGAAAAPQPTNQPTPQPTNRPTEFQHMQETLDKATEQALQWLYHPKSVAIPASAMGPPKDVTSERDV